MFMKEKSRVVMLIALLCLLGGMGNIVFAQYIPTSTFTLTAACEGDYSYEDAGWLWQNYRMDVEVDSIKEDGETGYTVSQIDAIHAASVVMTDPDYGSVPIMIWGDFWIDLRCNTPSSAYSVAFSREQVEVCWTADWDNDDVVFHGEYQDVLIMQNGGWTENSKYRENYQDVQTWTDSGTGTYHRLYYNDFDIYSYSGFVSPATAEEGVSLRYLMRCGVVNNDSDEDAYAEAEIDADLACYFFLD